MSKNEKQTIVVELGPGQHVHTDTSGSVLKNEDGDVEEVIFFVSPRYMRELADGSGEPVV